MLQLNLLFVLLIWCVGSIRSISSFVFTNDYVTKISSCSSSCYSSRPSTIIPLLSNQFGHDRLVLSKSLCAIKQQEDVDIISLNKSITSISADVVDNDTLYSTKKEVIEEESSSSSSSIPQEFLPILFLCFLVTFLSALDRVALSIAILPMSSEFGYTETIKGQISSAVSYGYGLAILPIGLAVSVVSPRTLMAVGVSIWSVATLCTPLMAELSSNSGSIEKIGDATTTLLLPLLLIRGLMGGAEAVVLPTMQRILSQWVPVEKKATALAITISGFQLGTVGAYLISPIVLDFMSGLDGGVGNIPGWRGMFYIYGLAGLLWLLPWWLVAKDKESSINIEEEDCEETLVNTLMEDDASLVLKECIVDDITTTTPQTKIQEVQALLQSAPWAEFAKSPAVYGMTLAHAAKNFELYNLLAWTPTFFTQQYGLNVKESAIFSVLPSLCGMIGGLTAGTVGDYVLTKFIGDEKIDCEEAIRKRTQVRKLFQSIALLGPATCLYLLSSLPDAATAQLLLGGAVGLQAFDAAGFGAATQEKSGERWAGLLYSLTSLPGVLVGSVSVSITGKLLDAMETNEAGWTAVYQLNSAVCVAGALCFLLLYDSKKEFE